MENDLQCRLSRCKSIAAVLFENAFSDLKVLLNEIGVKEQVRPNNVDYSTWRMANQIKVYNQCFDYFSENEGLVNSIKKRYNLTGIWCLSTTHGCRMFLTKDNMIAKQTYDLENGKFAESKKEPMGIAVFSSNMTVRRRKSHSSVSFDITMRPEGNKASVVGRTIVGQAIGGTVGGYLGALSAVEQNQRAEQLKNDYVPTLKEVQFDEYGLAFEDQFTDSKMWVYFYAVEIGKKLYVENFINEINELSTDESVEKGLSILNYVSENDTLDLERYYEDRGIIKEKMEEYDSCFNAICSLRNQLSKAKEDLARISPIHIISRNKIMNEYENMKSQMEMQLSAICNIFENSTTNTLSCADEIMKYKELLDLGIISQSEFDIKKKQLLDL